MSAALETASAMSSLPRDCGIEPWHSPHSGALLHRDSPHSLAAGSERWPLIDGIAYLRLGRDALIRDVLRALDDGEAVTATALLLQDRAEDSMAPEVPLQVLRLLVARRPQIGLREAMRGLGLGDAAEYFAHRWSDPTWLSGLALVEAHWPRPVRLLDVGCGIGQFLRVAERHVPTVCGADLVFAHLWLARHFVVASASLVCCDANQAWPLADDSADLVLLQDVLPSLADPPAAAAEARRVAGEEAILCDGLRGQDDAALFAPALLYDDSELTASMLARRAPRPRSDAAEADAVEGFGLAAGSAAEEPAQPIRGLLAAPPRGTALRRNPLYVEEADGACVRRFPSAAYAARVERLATYPSHVAARARVIAGADPSDDTLIRRRVWVDLPQRW